MTKKPLFTVMSNQGIPHSLQYVTFLVRAGVADAMQVINIQGQVFTEHTSGAFPFTIRSEITRVLIIIFFF